MESIKRILVILLAVAILIGLSAGFFRFKVDVENVAVEVMADFQELFKASMDADMSLDEFLLEVKEKGLSTVLLPQDMAHQEIIGAISNAGLKAVPLLQIGSSFQEDRADAIIATFFPNREVRPILAVNSRLPNRMAYQIREYASRKNVGLLLLGPRNVELEKSLCQVVGYRCVRPLEFSLSDLEKRDFQDSLGYELRHTSSRLLYLNPLDQKDQIILMERLATLTRFLDTRGFYVHSEMRFRGVQMDVLSLIGLVTGVVAAGLLILNNIYSIGTNWDYILLFFVFLLFNGIALKWDIPVVRKVLALLATSLFPVLGIASQFKSGRLIALESPPKDILPMLIRTIRGFIRLCFLSASGGTIGAAFVGDTVFIKGLELPFKNVFASSIAMFLVLIVFIDRFIREDGESIMDLQARLKDFSFKTRDLLWVILMVVIVGIDHFLGFLPWLSRGISLSLALGISFYFPAAYLGMKDALYGPFFVSLLLAGGGFASLATALCRPTYPMVIVLLDATMSIVLGMGVGILLFFALAFIGFLNYEGGEDMRRRPDPYA